MKPDAKIHARLKRLERLRIVERAATARTAAVAQSTAGRLAAVAMRSAALADEYSAHHAVTSGGALHSRAGFGSEMHILSCQTADESAHAAAEANRRSVELAHATRHRDLATEQVQQSRKRIARLKDYDLDVARSLNNRRQEGR